MSKRNRNRSNSATQVKPSDKLVKAIFGDTEAEAEKLEAEVEAKVEAEAEVAYEPSEAELKVIENQENDSQTIVTQLEAELAKAQRAIVERKAELTKAGASGSEADELMAISASILEAQGDVATLQGKLLSQRADSVRQELIEGIGKLVASVADRITITKLLYEASEVEIEGVKTIKPILRINDAISTIGKRKASTSSTTTKSKLWHKGNEKLASRELCDRIEAQAPDIVAMVSGTAKVAPDRAIKAIKKRGLQSLAWLNDWQSVDDS